MNLRCYKDANGATVPYTASGTYQLHCTSLLKAPHSYVIYRCTEESGRASWIKRLIEGAISYS